MDTVEGKIIFITGGAGGIGLAMIKYLLKNKAKGIALIDISEETGTKIVKEMNETFGKNKIIFIKTDIVNSIELQAAYKKTIEVFGNLDIVINNAGIVDEFNWKKTIAVNLVAAIESSYLALEKYLPKYKSGKEGIIVNTSSVLGFTTIQTAPVYNTTKHGLIGFGKSIGGEAYYEKFQVRVLTICPGLTAAPCSQNAITKIRFPEISKQEIQKTNTSSQSPERVGEALIEIIRKGKNGSLWVIEEDKPVYEIIIPSKDILKV